MAFAYKDNDGDFNDSSNSRFDIQLNGNYPWNNSIDSLNCVSVQRASRLYSSPDKEMAGHDITRNNDSSGMTDTVPDFLGIGINQ